MLDKKIDLNFIMKKQQFIAGLCVNPLPVYVTRIEQCLTKSRTLTQDVNRLKKKPNLTHKSPH